MEKEDRIPSSVCEPFDDTNIRHVDGPWVPDYQYFGDWDGKFYENE